MVEVKQGDSVLLADSLLLKPKEKAKCTLRVKYTPTIIEHIIAAFLELK